MMWLRTVGILLLLAVLSAVFSDQLRAVPTPKEADVELLAVQVQTILPQPFTLEVSSRGSVTPAVETALLAEVAGKIVSTSPALVAGGAFKSGETLVQLDDTQLNQMLQQAEATLARRAAEQRHAAYERKRLAKLAKERLISRSALETAERSERVANANLLDAAERLKQAKRDLTRTRITAPYDGRVREESVDVGQFLGKGTRIASVYSDDTVEVRLPIHDRELAFLDLPINQLGHLAEGERPDVILTAEYGGTELRWQGTVVRRDAEIDGFSRMVHLIAQVPATSGDMPLPVGLFVDARIQGKSLDQAIVLPKSALRANGQVLVVDSENRLRFRTVESVRLDDERILVRTGLEAGEQVCLTPIVTPVDGMYVAPIAAEPT